MFILEKDESVLDSTGKVIFYSFPRFVAHIATGDKCFICGASPGSKPFNNEHVFPDWILRRYKLHDRVLTIPNRSTFRYGALRIPCCVDCNSEMGALFETPIREMFAAGYDAFCDGVQKCGVWPVFIWMSLIFLKAHLKDKSLRFHRHLRKPRTTIGESYSWEDLHHIHCLCRSFHTGAHIHESAFGSLLVLPAKQAPHIENFDYIGLHLSQTVLLRIDGIAILAVLNDGRAAASFLQDELRKIGGPLSPLQLREIATQLAFTNLRLEKRSRFHSEIDLLEEKHVIRGDGATEFSAAQADPESYGYMLFQMCKDFLATGPADAQLVANIKSGKWTFLVDGAGKFAADSMDLIPDPAPSQ